MVSTIVIISIIAVVVVLLSIAMYMNAKSKIPKAEPSFDGAVKSQPEIIELDDYHVEEGDDMPVCTLKDGVKHCN